MMEFKVSFYVVTYHRVGNCRVVSFDNTNRTYNYAAPYAEVTREQIQAMKPGDKLSLGSYLDKVVDKISQHFNDLYLFDPEDITHAEVHIERLT